MPRDGNGVVADIAMLSRGVVARTNKGKLYEQYTSMSSRQIRTDVIKLLNVTDVSQISQLRKTEIDVVFDYILDYLSHYNTLQYLAYVGELVVDGSDGTKPKGLTYAEKIEILEEIYSKEFYIIYNVGEDESAWDIYLRLENSRFKLKTTPIYVKDVVHGGYKELKSKGVIGPIYIQMLNKIADKFLCASTMFINGYGLGTGKAKDDGRYPYNFKTVRGFGESETRLVCAYAKPKLLQIIMDRGRSTINHKIYYRNQLEAGNLLANNLLHNRVEDADDPTAIVKGLIESAGVTISSKSLNIKDLN